MRGGGRCPRVGRGESIGVAAPRSGRSSRPPGGDAAFAVDDGAPSVDAQLRARTSHRARRAEVRPRRTARLDVGVLCIWRLGAILELAVAPHLWAASRPRYPPPASDRAAGASSASWSRRSSSDALGERARGGLLQDLRRDLVALVPRLWTTRTRSARVYGGLRARDLHTRSAGRDTANAGSTSSGRDPSPGPLVRRARYDVRACRAIR